MRFASLKLLGAPKPTDLLISNARLPRLPRGLRKEDVATESHSQLRALGASQKRGRSDGSVDAVAPGVIASNIDKLREASDQYALLGK